MKVRARYAGVCVVAIVLFGGIAAFASPGPASGPTRLLPSPLTSLLPSLGQVTQDGIAGESPDPSPVDSAIQTLTDIVPTPLQSLLPALTQGLQDGSGDGGSGSPHPRTGGAPIAETARASSGAGTATAARTPLSAKDAASVETSGTRIARADGGPADRALRLAGPMSAPVGAAALALLGITMFARSRSSFEALENEKEAVGGWTSIRL